MKLVSTMFHDPEPNPENFQVHEPASKDPDYKKLNNIVFNNYMFREAHSEWRRRQKRVQHRLRFYGFTRTEDTDVIELTNGKLTITFEDGGPGVGLYYENSNVCVFNLYYANGLSLDLFRDTVKENDINLQET